MRFHDWMTRDNVGTDTLQTSGTFSGPPIPWRNHGLTGNAILTQDYTLHSYQCVPLGDPPWFGQFNIEVSNDGENYTCIYSQDMDTGLAGPLADPRSVAYSDTWTFFVFTADCDRNTRVLFN